MAKINWKDVLGWGDEELKGLRIAGFSFLKQGHYEKALAFFEALVVISKNHPYDFQTLGAIYLQLGDNEKSVEILDKALLLAPNHEPSLLNKAKALLSLNRKEEAFTLITALRNSMNPYIASDAFALILAYR